MPHYAVELSQARLPSTPAWSNSVILNGRKLTVSILAKVGNDSTVVEIHRSIKLIARAADTTYFYDPFRPVLTVKGPNAYLAYAATPGAGSGEYAVIWRIWDNGRHISPLGRYLYGDLHLWFTHGTIREIRPAKYATEDVVRKYPHLFEREFYRNKKFVIDYRFNVKRHTFNLSNIRIVRHSFSWRDHVRLP